MVLRLPYLFLVFWYANAPLRLLRTFSRWNNSLLHMLSLPLFLRTFFKPLKNEYRGDLVGFSIGMGIAIKTVLIFVDILFFCIALTFEIGIFIFFLLMPIITIGILFFTL